MPGVGNRVTKEVLGFKLSEGADLSLSLSDMRLRKEKESRMQQPCRALLTMRLGKEKCSWLCGEQ